MQFSDARIALVFALGYLIKDTLGGTALGWYHSGSTLFYFKDGKYFVSDYGVEAYPYLKAFPDEFQNSKLAKVVLDPR